MSYIPNDGDVILDVVLTDLGRSRLAAGDGSFKIAKFALFDQEIVYSLYNKNHPSGSAYYDLEILQTPIFEAFSNNSSYGHSKLVSIARTNLLYLPVIKVNENFSPSTKMTADGAFYVLADGDTEDRYTAAKVTQGIIFGETLTGGSYIKVDQGLDTTEVPPSFTLDSDLVETQYEVEIDNRLGKIVTTSGKPATVSYVDDDQMAYYYFNLGVDTDYVSENSQNLVVGTETISGPRGTVLEFGIGSSLEINTGYYMFQLLGSTATISGYANTYYIDSIVTVTGLTTGYSVQIPVRFVKV
jgi:hypothetical protein